MVEGGAQRPSGAVERVGNKTGQGEADSEGEQAVEWTRHQAQEENHPKNQQR